MERKKILKTNLSKAYALIFQNYCHKTIQNRIEEKPDFDTKIRNNPIELLKTIREVMHVPAWAKYLFVALTEALVRVLNFKQLERELVTEFTKRFKQSKDVLKSYIVTEMTDGFVEQTEKYLKANTTKQAELKKKGFETMVRIFDVKNM